MEAMIEFNLDKDFSRCPGGRFKRDGPSSGEEPERFMREQVERDA